MNPKNSFISFYLFLPLLAWFCDVFVTVHLKTFTSCETEYAGLIGCFRSRFAYNFLPSPTFLCFHSICPNLKTSHFFQILLRDIVNEKRNDCQLRNDRRGRNPQTGSEIYIKAAKVPKFIAGKALKEAVKCTTGKGTRSAFLNCLKRDLLRICDQSVTHL